MNRSHVRWLLVLALVGLIPAQASTERRTPAAPRRFVGPRCSTSSRPNWRETSTC